MIFDSSGEVVGAAVDGIGAAADVAAHSGVHTVLITIATAIGLGILAQLIADRLKVPAILPLLIFGMAAGPSVMGWFHPDSLGPVLDVLVHLGVAVILFEGGLSLDPDKLLKVGGAVRNLLTLGVVITALGAAWVAHDIVGMSWQIAALFGAIMTVTGPTVIVPLLRHMIAPREVKLVLISEGLIIDPIGAVLAYLVLQWIQRAGNLPPRELFNDVAVLFAIGTAFGFAAAQFCRKMLSGRLISAELRNPVVLAVLVVTYLAADSFAPQSGILSSVVMGLTLSSEELPGLVQIKAFKEELTVLLISMLFVLLSGNLDLQAMQDLGWKGPAAAALLIFLVRPVSVFLSVWPSQLGFKERLVLALNAPRGIVAAAVTSLAATELASHGIEGSQELEGLVYLSIILTGAFATAMAIILPRVLGYTDDPARRRTVIVGANALSTELAKELVSRGRTTVVIDQVPWRLAKLRQAGVLTVCGDARDTASYEEAGVERDTQVVAMTSNDELNLLVANLVHGEFGIEHPAVAQAQPPDKSRSWSWVDLWAGKAVKIEDWSRNVDNGAASLIYVDPRSSEQSALLREVDRISSSKALVLLGWKGGQPDFELDDDLDVYDKIAVLVTDPKLRMELEAAAVNDDSSSSSPGPAEL